ncbi:MAG: sulfur carrier protein ThiS [Muribaculaceae bacterium]|nr:sulfur carrier protein ThiS [Muribaculaceae bacterium]MDE6558552.1 sulfur carrier protein ThiS [Muribaculaceae bacterium]
MNIIVNNNNIELPANIITISDFAKLKNIPVQATAIALNGKLVKSDRWSITKLSEMDNLLVISASFGG